MNTRNSLQHSTSTSGTKGHPQNQQLLKKIHQHQRRCHALKKTTSSVTVKTPRKQQLLWILLHPTTSTLENKANAKHESKMMTLSQTWKTCHMMMMMNLKAPCRRHAPPTWNAKVSLAMDHNQKAQPKRMTPHLWSQDLQETCILHLTPPTCHHQHQVHQLPLSSNCSNL